MTRDDIDRNFGLLVNDVARLMKTAFDRRGRDLGLTRSQWWILSAIYVRGGATQSELAGFLDLDEPTVGRLLGVRMTGRTDSGRLLDRLEEKGWVERRTDEIDRRGKRIHLTETVQGLTRQLRRIAADLRRDALKGLGEEERERFVDTLIKVKANVLSLDEMRGTGTERRLSAAADD